MKSPEARALEIVPHDWQPEFSYYNPHALSSGCKERLRESIAAAISEAYEAGRSDRRRETGDAGASHTAKDSSTWRGTIVSAVQSVMSR